MPIKWYSWHGAWSDRHAKEVCICRNVYDLFQNVCCPAISYSKLTCNTNVAALMPGPVAQYTLKSQLKDTQEGDAAEYSRVAEASRKVLSGARKHQSDQSEACRRLLMASFSHQKTNVVGTAMASFLTRNGSRFIMSHLVWCPLRDVGELLSGGQVNATILHGKTPFVQTIALHCLCRPPELENLNVFDFYSPYKLVRATSTNSENLYHFVNGLFQHPSYQPAEDYFLQGVCPRETVRLAKVYQYDFPDSAEFGVSLLDCTTPVTTATEDYSKLALILSYPNRKLDDILLQESYTLRLREGITSGVIGEKAATFLQNLQDARANSSRAGQLEDDLQRNTEAFVPADQAFNYQNGENDNEGECEENDGKLDELLNLIATENQATSEESGTSDIRKLFFSEILCIYTIFLYGHIFTTTGHLFVKVFRNHFSGSYYVYHSTTTCILFGAFVDYLRMYLCSPIVCSYSPKVVTYTWYNSVDFKAL